MLFIIFYLLFEAISSTFSTVYPGKVKSLQVMGPAGLGVKTPFVANFIKIPIIGEILIRFFGYSHIWQRGPGAYQGMSLLISCINGGA